MKGFEILKSFAGKVENLALILHWYVVRVQEPLAHPIGNPHGIQPIKKRKEKTSKTEKKLSL